MLKIFTAFVLLMFSTVSFAGLVQYPEKSNIMVYRLTHEKALNIVKKTNDFYKQSLLLRHTDGKEVFKNNTEYYGIMSKSLRECNQLGKFGDINCFISNLGNMKDEQKNLSSLNYLIFISEENAKKSPIITDLYLINFYYFMGEVYSDCNIEDENQRLECLGKIPFLEIEVSK